MSNSYEDVYYYGKSLIFVREKELTHELKLYPLVKDNNLPVVLNVINASNFYSYRAKKKKKKNDSSITN